MRSEWSISVTAENLREALAVVVPVKKSRSLAALAVTISFNAAGEQLVIEEARYALKAHAIPATGCWPEQVQVDGRRLRTVCGALPKDGRVELAVLNDELCILSGEGQFSLKRLDPGGRPDVKRRGLPPTKGHGGPVAHPPDPREKRFAPADTWDFSARVPMPQHRKSRDK